MKLSLKDLTLISKGSNSEIYKYQSGEKMVVLKVVPAQFKK